MKITDWRTKNIEFQDFERKKVTQHVRRLISIGWYLQQGGFDENDLIYGDQSDRRPEFEEIQLNNTFNPPPKREKR